MPRLLPLALLLCALSVHAESWARVGEHSRVDLAALKYRNASVIYPIRWDNPDDANDYLFIEVETDCKSTLTRFPRLYLHRPDGPTGFHKPHDALVQPIRLGWGRGAPLPPVTRPVKLGWDSELGFLSRKLCAGGADAATIESALFPPPLVDIMPYEPPKAASVP